MRDIINELVWAHRSIEAFCLSATIAARAERRERNIKAQIDFLLLCTRTRRAAAASFSFSCSCSSTLQAPSCSFCVCVSVCVCCLHPLENAEKLNMRHLNDVKAAHNLLEELGAGRAGWLPLELCSVDCFDLSCPFCCPL